MQSMSRLLRAEQPMWWRLRHHSIAFETPLYRVPLVVEYAPLALDVEGHKFARGHDNLFIRV